MIGFEPIFVDYTQRGSWFILIQLMQVSGTMSRPQSRSRVTTVVRLKRERVAMRIRYKKNMVYDGF